MELLSILVIVLLVLMVVFVALGVKVVPQGSNYTVERFGQYTKTLTPGLHLITPFIDTIGSKLSVMEQVLDVPSQEVITRDNAMVTVDGVVFYQILDVAKASYEVLQLELAILNLTMTNVRTVMGGMDLDELLSQRDKINAALMDVVDQATNPWGVKVTRIEIKDISPPRDLVEAMGRQMKAEREKRAEILNAEGMKQAAVLRAEGMKQAAILEAEGRREAAFRDAEARERAAEAEARATEVVSKAIAEGDVQAVNYFVALRYVDSLQAIASAPSGKLVLMPWEASGVLGALAGVGEIARETFGGKGGDGPQGGAPGGGGGGKLPPAPRPGMGAGPVMAAPKTETLAGPAPGTASGPTAEGVGSAAGGPVEGAGQVPGDPAAAQRLAKVGQELREAFAKVGPWG
ncbi:SPFH domain-containing protein [Roseospirillum parvum]|uniref:Protein QmcA n=1 Tax=Roseospirillum parvum TaxID=83401 RepID=A0A1G8FTP1_9PROT|nr:SPFH domain-containing protein [Roseospirillum parvum]SDH85485.1 Regulator of protease activity HflC, stomatin/prohibitin superfamily [Roseospirillum parvum]